MAEQYKRVDERVERLLQVVSELAKKWLNGGYEKKVKIEIRLPAQDPKGCQEAQFKRRHSSTIVLRYICAGYIFRCLNIAPNTITILL